MVPFTMTDEIQQTLSDIVSRLDQLEKKIDQLTSMISQQQGPTVRRTLPPNFPTAPPAPTTSKFVIYVYALSTDITEGMVRDSIPARFASSIVSINVHPPKKNRLAIAHINFDDKVSSTDFLTQKMLRINGQDYPIGNSSADKRAYISQRTLRMLYPYKEIPANVSVKELNLSAGNGWSQVEYDNGTQKVKVYVPASFVEQ